ncbi:hypothetical protein ONS95_008182 [Cadophora gregata]|uniref:uncharacterized protein n=1 Tax=Cadophora gregata TaxID=51156 RepID=UPI0026DDB594|nr:uncharacterized protein ONS95_008182 [Cadophora gregata]KAK0106766.1 hypothetical protein ONS96_004384 [Cadophora gregata f. sp. sojae]KAK0119340.1 hypothetical protein ONS96_012393 [Cadophora gregata f. sp. sojae]KAK0126594.1 hypothetical protein ONS95_008182 [Cadophora gregata]
MSAEASDQSVPAQSGEKEQPNTPPDVSQVTKSVRSVTMNNVFLGDLGEEIVTLCVGTKRKAFRVHQKLLCQSVDYFDKAFNCFKEGVDGVMYLPDDSPDAIGIFIDWLYRGDIPIKNTQSHLNNLVDVYIFAHKICLVTLKDKTMNTIRDLTRRYGLVDKHFIPNTEKVWTSTGEVCSGLLIFCVHITVHGMVLRSVEVGESSSEFKPRKLCHDDMKTLWDLGKGSFKLFAKLLRMLEYEMQISPQLLDFTARREVFLKPEHVCWFHSHKRDDPCTLEGEHNEESKLEEFLEDI